MIVWVCVYNIKEEESFAEGFRSVKRSLIQSVHLNNCTKANMVIMIDKWNVSHSTKTKSTSFL